MKKAAICAKRANKLTGIAWVGVGLYLEWIILPILKFKRNYLLDEDTNTAHCEDYNSCDLPSIQHADS